MAVASGPTKEAKQGRHKRGTSVERTRSHVLARTGGKGPGSSRSFRFGGTTGVTEKQAQTMAERWLNEN